MEKKEIHNGDFEKCRMDFTIEVLSSDDSTRTMQVKLEPDPRRYTKVERDGESWFLDKYLNYLIPLSAFVEKMAGLPIYHLSSSIDSAPEYATKRQGALAHQLKTNEYVAPSESALAHTTFSANQNKREVSFISVDVCGGSALRKKDEASFERAYKILLSEFCTVVGQFNGTILKLTGDGFIAYIDHPSFTSLCDTTIDLGLSLLTMLRMSINPVLEASGLSQIHVRIGADYGEASFRNISIPATGFTDIEVASDALNRAVKIQETCSADEFRIGYMLYRLIHVQWLERATEVAFDGNAVGVAGYKIYRMV